MRRTTTVPGVIAVSLAITVNFPGGNHVAYGQDPSEVGQWEILPTCVFGHFEIVLPTGKVLLWGRGQNNSETPATTIQEDGS